MSEIWASNSDQFASTEGFLKDKSKTLLEVNPPDNANKFFDFENKNPIEGSIPRRATVSTPLLNAFIPLRIVRSRRLIHQLSASDYLMYLLYFESTLHDQLSFISIPDSRFDPAELAFCLEGMLLSSRSSVGTALFKRVLDVLGKAQETSAHWRPTKPFLRNERGMVLFPLSVETANALIRACQLLDSDYP